MEVGKRLQEQYNCGSKLLRFLMRQKSGAFPIDPDEQRGALRLLNQTPEAYGTCGENSDHHAVVDDTCLCRDCCAEILGRAQ